MNSLTKLYHFVHQEIEELLSLINEDDCCKLNEKIKIRLFQSPSQLADLGRILNECRRLASKRVDSVKMDEDMVFIGDVLEQSIPGFHISREEFTPLSCDERKLVESKIKHLAWKILPRLHQIAARTGVDIRKIEKLERSTTLDRIINAIRSLQTDFPEDSITKKAIAEFLRMSKKTIRNHMNHPSNMHLFEEHPKLGIRLSSNVDWKTER